MSTQEHIIFKNNETGKTLYYPITDFAVPLKDTKIYIAGKTGSHPDDVLFYITSPLDMDHPVSDFANREIIYMFNTPPGPYLFKIKILNEDTFTIGYEWPTMSVKMMLNKLKLFTDVTGLKEDSHNPMINTRDTVKLYREIIDHSMSTLRATAAMEFSDIIKLLKVKTPAANEKFISRMERFLSSL